MWTPPPVFETAKGRLDEFLKDRGFAALPVVLSPGAFGSAHAEYRGKGGNIRLVWDGKESALWAEVGQDGNWQDLEAPVARSASSLNKDQGPDRAASLVGAAKALLASGWPGAPVR